MKLKPIHIAVAAMLAFTLAAVAPASPAQAYPDTCDYVYWRPNGEGKLTFFKSYNVKEAPLGACDKVASVSAGTDFYIWCIYYNMYGNMWFYGRIAGTQTKGWAHRDAFGPKIELGDRDDDDNQDGITKLEYCGF
ncbi:hypothetical protein FB565_006537 [Actinoplanes lutulentus]|uniref:SH3 domain-containing protein n=1 Tax=Actinoplanes lutulentus TaxID=1287878 RepID=A0A327ZHW2_9ACTN|nr:hypothetical protein [Actinoplanes lutulentus]MBB2946769.1 hypothetical protein [Actinoplanes lutulentus]RAK35661.1 hypothetical protein B0I29_109135 [Actinoplanes lutulentus]